MTLVIDHLTKRFGSKVAVSDLSLTIQPGQILGLIGQNGAGKTTTFRMILDFIQPDSGTITFNGQPLTQAFRQQIGFLPEERGLYQKWTIEEQVCYFAELHGMPRSAAKKALGDWMRRLHVVGKPSDKVQALSKGNAQKVQIITTLIFEPKLLILDEPFTGMDPVNTAILIDEIRRLKAQGTVIIFSAHNMASVEQLSDHLLMLKNGVPVLSGATQTIRDGFGRTHIYVETTTPADQLAALPGVVSVTPSGRGLAVRVSDASVGRAVFKAAVVDDYVAAFVQSPPTLDEIFRMTVSEEGQ